MRINSFKAIGFDSKFWKTPNSEIFNNLDTVNKIQTTENVITFLDDQISKGVAKIDSCPAIYVLRLTNHFKSVISIVAEIDYNDRLALFPNEKTDYKKLECYKKFFNRYRLQTTPVLTFYKSETPIKLLVEKIISNVPSSIADIRGTLYELWKVREQKEIIEIQSNFRNINKLYIADGHHRFSIFNDSTLKLSSRIMIAITDSNSILLKSCHRVIMGNINPDWMNAISNFAVVKFVEDCGTYGKNNIVLKFRDGKSFEIIAKHGNGYFHDMVKRDIIEGAFKVSDYENSVFPIPGTFSIHESKRIFELYQGSSAIIFVPHISITDFLNVVDSGEKLPPTSTWFEPKVTDGFIVRRF
ncbi:MAG: DUF1015 family protein [Holosporales bacterium]|jgi:uncharacterized protein (DUF1015 family)|nr:DUF1015 family protein [Holosporales bacterium]